MDVTKELIIRFFEGKCSAAEAEMVVHYLEQHPEANREFLPDQEWQEADLGAQDLPGPVTNDIWSSIDAATRPPRRIWLQRLTAAAALIGVFVAIYVFYTNDKKKDHPASIAHNTAKPTIPLLKIRNSGVKDTLINLADGSVAELAALSEMVYAISNELTYRSIQLTGKATFRVANDKSRPFTVYQGKCAVTALGTVFSVMNEGEKNKTTVRLFEGKVIVKTKEEDRARSYYLLPGNELIYNNNTGVARLQLFPVQNSFAGPEKSTKNWFTFNNGSLPETLDQLAAIYGVSIDYSQTDLQNISFIGKINKADSLQTILRDIASLNNLIVTREGKVIRVKKR